MNLYEFNVLPIRIKTEYILNKGTFLMSRKGTQALVHLYYVCDYYVEIFYGEKTNKILSIRTFNDTEKLDRYLDQMVVAAFF